MGVTVSSSHVVSAAPSSSGGGLLTLCPCSSARSLSWETVLHKLLLQRESFPQAAALHKLPQCGSFRNRLFQRESPWGHKPCQKTCSDVGSSLHGSTGPGRSLLQRGLPTGSQPPSGIHLFQHGVPSTGYRWRSAPPWTSMDCRGASCLTMVFITGCKGELSALTFRAPPSPSFFTDLGVCRVGSLTLSHSSFLTAISPQFFSPS